MSEKYEGNDMNISNLVRQQQLFLAAEHFKNIVLQIKILGTFSDIRTIINRDWRWELSKSEA